MWGYLEFNKITFENNLWRPLFLKSIGLYGEVINDYNLI
jgi:hypothetical protein